MTQFARVVLIVVDGVGIGELPDASYFGDEGSHTIGNLCRAVGGLELPTLQRLGLGNIEPLQGVPPSGSPLAFYGKMMEVSAGKDSTTGHWEIAGLILSKPFPTYPKGFPPEVIQSFESAIQRKVLGNKPASGTAIIEELGEEHIKTGCPIVYTSADSVFQVAAHEDVIPVDELYRMCRKARELLIGEHALARVIARPFVGAPGSFQRTPRRKDFSLPPLKPTVLDLLVESGRKVITIGKVDDLFAQRGISQSWHVDSNSDGCRLTLEKVQEKQKDAWSLMWTTLLDFDTKYGHRNDVIGFARALREFDDWLSGLLDALHDDDLLILTADHGNDPTTPSTDHSREHVPVLVYSKRLTEGGNLGVRRTFADVAATISENFGLRPPAGKSLLCNCKLSCLP